MEIKLTEITVRDIANGYLDSEENGVVVVYNKALRLCWYAALALLAIAAAFGLTLAAYALLAGARISTENDVRFLSLVGIGVVVLLWLALSRFSRKYPKGKAPPELKALLLNRLEAVERWDD